MTAAERAGPPRGPPPGPRPRPKGPRGAGGPENQRTRGTNHRRNDHRRRKHHAAPRRIGAGTFMGWGIATGAGVATLGFGTEAAGARCGMRWSDDVFVGIWPQSDRRADAYCQRNLQRHHRGDEYHRQHAAHQHNGFAALRILIETDDGLGIDVLVRHGTVGDVARAFAGIGDGRCGIRADTRRAVPATVRRAPTDPSRPCRGPARKPAPRSRRRTTAHSPMPAPHPGRGPSPARRVPTTRAKSRPPTPA